MLSNYNYRKNVLFDNNLPNFGRIIVIYNESAQVSSTLLLFGSSSAYSMFHFISRIFQTVVFVHTAGNVDQNLIREVNPDYFCMQTNARFVVKSPTTNESVKKYIAHKKETFEKGDDSQYVMAGTIPNSKLGLVEYLRQL